MKAREIKIAKLGPRDIGGSPEEFEKRYADRRPKPKSVSPLAEPERPGSMNELMERFGIQE